MSLSTAQKKFALAGLSLSFFGAGTIVGALISKSKMKSLYSDLAEQEIAEARKYFEQQFSKPASPEQLAMHLVEEAEAGDAHKELERIVTDYRSVANQMTLDEVETEPEEETIAVVEKTENVFNLNGWDQETEEAQRGAAPYIISYTEFMENEPEHQQLTIAYFEGDGILADEKDEPIEDEETVIGAPENLKFGHGSRDNNIVYIRNDLIELDFEVLRHSGKYAEEVMGFIEHSYNRKTPRFRLHE